MADTNQQAVPVPAGATFGPAQSDPNASQAKPVPAGATFGPAVSASSGVSGDYGAPESTIDKIGDTAYGVQAGIGKGMGDTVSGVAHLIHKLPGIGETLAPQQGITSLDKQDASDPKSISEAAGRGIEGIAEWETGDELLTGISKGVKMWALAKKYPIIAEALQVAKDHPVIAKIMGGATTGAAVGGAEGAAKGASTGTAAQGAKTGAEIGAVGGVAAEAVAPAIKFLRGLNPFRGVSAAQAPAEAAIRGGVQESTAAAGTASPTLSAGVQTNPILKGAQTVLDEPLTALQASEKAAYKKVDDAAGFDLKQAKLQLDNDQYNLKQLGNTPEDIAKRVDLSRAIDDSTTRIQAAESKLSKAGINPKGGDIVHTQRMAGQDFKNLIVKATSPDGTINVDKLLNQSKALRFSKRGDRLVQFMGKDGADAYMTQLQDAQKAGVHAMKAQAVGKWIIKNLPYVGAAAGTGAAAYELATK